MLFRKKMGIRGIVSSHYRAMLQIARASALAKDPEFELLPAIFVITDYAAACAGKDRRRVANEALDSIASLYSSLDNALLDKRCALYGEIIRGKSLRGDWFLGDISAMNRHAISKCAVLLGDILVNPPCANDYENAPWVVYGLPELSNFSHSVMMPLLNEMIRLFQAVYNL